MECGAACRPDWAVQASPVPSFPRAPPASCGSATPRQKNDMVLVNTATARISAVGILRLALQRRKVLLATTRVELVKKYSGSVLGPLWIALFPTMLVGVYLFIYTIVFPMKLPEFGGLDFALFVFSGLIPYLGLVEVLGTGTLAVKQNIHLVKNVMMPIELIPVRSVLVGIVSQIVSLSVLLLLTGVNGSLSWHVLWLPLAFIFQLMFLLGLVYFLSALAVSLPDINYFVSLLLMMLLFISPIGYQPESLPDSYWPILYLNPIYYMIQVYRDCLFFARLPEWDVAFVFISICVLTLAAGAGFFGRFKNVLIDYE
jgi:lipopolysaccharide transport system permease protein